MSFVDLCNMTSIKFDQDKKSLTSELQKITNVSSEEVWKLFTRLKNIQYFSAKNEGYWINIKVIKTVLLFITLKLSITVRPLSALQLR